MRGGLAGLLCAIVLLAGIAATGTTSATAGQSGFVTLRHARSGFSIQAPRGFRLSVNRGVYVLRNGNVTVSFSRSITGVTAAQFGTALVRQLGGRVVSRGGDARQYVAQLDRGSRREAFVVWRDGARLTVVTGSSATSHPLSLELVRRIGVSARGGYALRAPKAQPQASIPLRPYQSPDGGATALVPAEAGWDIQSTQGAIQGFSSNRGSFLFGFSINIFLPESVPAGTQNVLISPWLNAQTALTQFYPRLAQSVSNIRIRQVLRDAVLPSFSSSAMYLFDYLDNGRPWTGVATVGTDSPAKYSNFVWNFYFSGIGVPSGSNPAVGVALLRAWKSWDPSGAIAARTRQAQQLMNETNDIWQQTNEFRARTADQQSRDVGCLLQGYYIIEDNSRKYDLPPLPCGQIYTEK